MKRHFSDHSAWNNILHIINQHLDTTTRKVKLFGSQANHTATSTSDYDIAITGPVPLPYHIKRAIKIDLHESPYRVDIIDTHRVSKSFLQTSNIQTQ